MDGATAPLTRMGVRVRGSVQGVGFRPFVYRLAQACGLSGFVCNDSEGVWIEVEGAGVDRFLDRLVADAPPLSRIEAVEPTVLPPTGAVGFEVRDSRKDGAGTTRIPPDAGICRCCADELFDPANRRFGYPFIACCDCGPRFTMTARLPYDRPQTAMARFPLCPACLADYTDPAGRRFHAEPTACATCGPRYAADPARLAAALEEGQVLAIKGVGGFHLMADSSNAMAMARLRKGKERGAKPFAVLALNLASIEAMAEISPAERVALDSPARPIVLVRTRPPHPEGLAPGLDTLGVMLPSTGMQLLLFWHALGRPTGTAWREAPTGQLYVCTSANRGGEPLAVDAAAAAEALSGVADQIIDHDRPILVRADDPVLRQIEGRVCSLRRGRGQTPEPIVLPHDIPSTLALGGHLKAAVCVTRGREAFLAQHVGDLDDPDTVRFHRETVRHLLTILDVKPDRVACDLHPDFTSTRAAEAFGVPLVRVQHHHAHAAATASENGVAGAALALILDGYGYGTDGEAWGGEVLAYAGATAHRVGGLAPLPLPGGDRAAREPWRMALAALLSAGDGDFAQTRFAPLPLAAAVIAQIGNGHYPNTSAAGRLFDAAAALLGVAEVQTYEAEAPMRLEALVGTEPLPPPQGMWRVDLNKLAFAPLWSWLGRCPDQSEGARRFHSELVGGLTALVTSLATAPGPVLLGGGCLANRPLAEGLCAALRAAGLKPLLPAAAPSGDGGLALGQAWVAGLKEPQDMEEP